MHTKLDVHTIRNLAHGIKLLILDVDGVMTDGGIILIGETLEAKRFNVQDGIGVRLALEIGLEVAIITSRESVVVHRRATELGIRNVLQNQSDKVSALRHLLQKYGISCDATAYIGDDLQDIPIMKLVGLPIAVCNASQKVKDISVFVTTAHGGHGAVREAVEWLLHLRAEQETAHKKITG